MNVSDNNKKLREEKGLLQKQVVAGIGLKLAHYNKIEKDIAELSIAILNKLSKLYGVTIVQIIHSKNGIPKMIEDKNLIEKVRLIDKLDKKDKKTGFSIIDTMLTKQKFKDFFNKNIATL